MVTILTTLIYSLRFPAKLVCFQLSGFWVCPAKKSNLSNYHYNPAVKFLVVPTDVIPSSFEMLHLVSNILIQYYLLKMYVFCFCICTSSICFPQLHYTCDKCGATHFRDAQRLHLHATVSVCQYEIFKWLQVLYNITCTKVIMVVCYFWLLKI